MTRKKHTRNGTLTLAVLSLLAYGSLVNAANFDSLDHPTSNFGSLEQNIQPGSSSEDSSILNSFQQSEVNNKKDRYFDALNLLKNNKIDEARRKIAELLKQAPEEPQFYNLQALLETLTKNNAGAQQNYQKALDLDNNNLTAHLGLAKLALDTGDLAQSKDHASKALAINSKLTSAYLLLADIAYSQKNLSEAEHQLSTGLEKAIGNIEQEIQLINALGKFYVAQKQPEKLLPLAEDLVKRHQGNNQALSVLASVQIANNKTDLAEQTLKQIINSDKRDINHRLLLVKLINNQANREQDTLQLLDETIKIDANNPQAQIYKTAYLTKLKRTPEALAIADALEKQLPKLAIGQMLKGDVYLADKQMDKALGYFQQAYKIEANTSVLFKIADILQAQGKAADAIALLNTESTKNNKNNALHFKLATLYQQNNNPGQAQLHYETILNQQANNVLALNNLAWLYSEQNNPKSLELAKKAHDLAPDAPAITDTYGYILLKQGQPKEALPLLEKAATAAPKDNDIQYHLAKAYASTDDKAKAIEILEAIVKSEQVFSEKNAAQTLLQQLKSK